MSRANIQVANDSALYRALRPANADADWLAEFGQGEFVSMEERDALVDLVWDAYLGEQDDSTSRISSAELQIAARIIGSWIDGPNHDMGVETLMLLTHLKWTEPTKIAIDALKTVELSRERIREIALTHPAWIVRRDAVTAMGSWPNRVPKNDHEPARKNGCGRFDIFSASDDPHWRVRFAVAQEAVNWASDAGWSKVLNAAEQVLVDFRRVSCARQHRAHGIWAHLNQLANRTPSMIFDFEEVEDSQSEFDNEYSWKSDPDPLVLAWKIRTHHHDENTKLDRLASKWLGHSNQDVRTAAIKRLELSDHRDAFESAIEWLADPRHPGYAALSELVEHLDGDRLQWIVQMAIQDTRPDVKAWGAEHADHHSPEIQDSISVQSNGALTRFRLGQALDRSDPSASSVLQRLQKDPHPRVRAAAMTADLAESLVKNPTQESSWAVLREAAFCMSYSLPRRVMEVSNTPSHTPPRKVTFGETIHDRVVLPGKEAVAPLGLSGHYHLPEDGFQFAIESGVRLMFFEPNYASMIRFFRSLTTADRNRIQLVSGSFEADPRRIMKDIDRVLRLLGRDHIDLFLFFWVRDWTRISDAAIQALQRAKESGKIGAYSLSTHSLNLACEAIRRDWKPLMVRHNAAHRRAEEELLPLAANRQTPIILFNNTCYGRMLSDKVSAADCYRFSLSQSGVSACWTAPATIQQLKENLSVLSRLQLENENEESLLQRGQRVREMDHMVAKNIRYVD